MNFGIKHTLGVAEYMKENAYIFNLNKEDMWVLGYLHNINEHIDDKSASEHNAAILHRLGFKLAQYTSWCKVSPLTYCKNLIVEIPPKELILLWKAIYSTNLEGEIVGYDECLKELKNTFGLMNMNYMVAAETVNWLKEYDKSVELK